jgi:chromosome segregation ATPase
MQPYASQTKDGFPVALTPENFAAAVKRATDAEDHLRREVASSQALQAEVAERDAEIIKLRDHKATLVRTLTDAENEVADLKAEVANRNDIIASRDQEVDALKSDLEAEKTARRNGEDTRRNLVATLAVRDATIDGQNLQLANLRGTVDNLGEQLVTVRELLAFKDDAIDDLKMRLSKNE